MILVSKIEYFSRSELGTDRFQIFSKMSSFIRASDNSYAKGPKS